MRRDTKRENSVCVYVCVRGCRIHLVPMNHPHTAGTNCWAEIWGHSLHNWWSRCDSLCLFLYQCVFDRTTFYFFGGEEGVSRKNICRCLARAWPATFVCHNVAFSAIKHIWGAFSWRRWGPRPTPASCLSQATSTLSVLAQCLDVNPPPAVSEACYY